MQVYQPTATMSSTPVTLDAATISALSGALNSNIDKKFEYMQNDLGQTFAAFDTSVKKSMEDMIAPIFKRQDDFEERSEGRFKTLEDQILSINKLLKNPPPNTNPTMLPGNQHVSWPQPPLAPKPMSSNWNQSQTAAFATDVPQPDRDAIKNIINRARTIIGIGPITREHLDKMNAKDNQEALFFGALEFLRDELGVKETEIRNKNIVRVFAPHNVQNFSHIYVQFDDIAHADWCLYLGRTVLRGKDSRVFQYIPRQHYARFKALDNAAYQKRKFEGFKTRFEFTDTDITLLACPQGQYRYSLCIVHDLPPIDLSSSRTPPRGRNFNKRLRSLSPSPTPEHTKKTDRKQSPQKEPAKESVEESMHAEDPTKVDTPNEDFAKNDHEEENEVSALKSPDPIFPDIGMFNSVEASSPLTDRVLCLVAQFTDN